MTALHMKQNLIKTLGNTSYNELMELMDEATQNQRNTTIEVIEGRFEKRLSEESNRIYDKIDSLFKWMVGMWLTQMFALIALLKSLIH